MNDKDDGSMAENDRPKHQTLGEMLVEEELISEDQFVNALDQQRRDGGTVEDILLSQGIITAQELAVMRSIQFNVPLIDLNRHVVQPQAIGLVPQELARHHTLIPIDIVNDSLVVVMADPENISAIEDIKATSKMSVEVTLGIAEDIVKAIDLNYRSGSEIEKQISQFVPPTASEAEVTSELIARTPVAQMLDLIMGQAVRDRASDIHLEPQHDRIRIRFRVDGILRDVFSLPLNALPQLVSRVKILAEMNITEHVRPQDGQFSIIHEDKEIDIRTATIGTPNGERVTLRILDKTLSLLKLSDLGFRPDALSKFQGVMNSPFGLVLAGGPTGSGKTTTLYAAINQLDRHEKNIMTIEDPIEYRFTDINQIQVNSKAGITFASGLKSLMRHDPDVILVGEIRDSDTTAIAIQSALTGHLVFSSVHANDAVGVIFRLMNLGVEPYLIAATLSGVVAQRMVRRVCPHCGKWLKPSPEEKQIYEKETGEKLEKVYRGVGCNLCAQTGYLGRMGIFEVMLMSPGIRNLLHHNADIGEIREKALQEGMQPLFRDGMERVKEGLTTIAEVQSRVFSIE
jgi:type II secretory ATPase GspE/PulE/Tfp pilus assembly ATPase PilB-like protein